MTVTINQFNLAELFVIASFSMLIGMAGIGIAQILIGDPIFNNADWAGIGIMIGACTIGIAYIYCCHESYHENGR